MDWNTKSCRTSSGPPDAQSCASERRDVLPPELLSGLTQIGHSGDLQFKCCSGPERCAHPRQQTNLRSSEIRFYISGFDFALVRECGKKGKWRESNHHIHIILQTLHRPSLPPGSCPPCTIRRRGDPVRTAHDHQSSARTCMVGLRISLARRSNLGDRVGRSRRCRKKGSGPANTSSSTVLLVGTCQDPKPNIATPQHAPDCGRASA